MSDTEINKRIAVPMTNFDLEKYLEIDPSDIIKYSELSNYKSIQELLPEKDSFKVLLIEDKQNSGHFVGLFRFDKTIEYFNSYGAKWDTDWRFIPSQFQNEIENLRDKNTKDGEKRKSADWVVAKYIE